MSRNFRQLLEAKWAEGKFLCVGLDSDHEKLPQHLIKKIPGHGVRMAIKRFNSKIVEATKDLVCAYKINSAFYECLGVSGLGMLKYAIITIRRVAPDVPVILDFKRGDIGNTNKGYAKLAFEILEADAITIHPYLGREANQPFLDYKNKGIFVLCRTSNPGAGEFQDLSIDLPYPMEGMSSLPVYRIVARNVIGGWNVNGNCGLVAGATYPEEIRRIRFIGEKIPILIPGVGKQGGDLKAAVLSGCNHSRSCFIINSSSGIIFASSGEDYAEAARRETQKLHDEITTVLAERAVHQQLIAREKENK